MQVRDSIIFEGDRCWRVAKLFDVCTQRREKIAQEAARLYRNGRYLGDCTIMYEIRQDLCELLMSI